MVTYKNDNKWMTALRGVRGSTANFLFLTVSSFQDGNGQLFELLPFLWELSYAVDKWGLVSNLAIALLMISLKETKRQLRSVEESSVMQRKKRKDIHMEMISTLAAYWKFPINV